MSGKIGLMVLLTATLLVIAGNGLNWQGAGNMNSTVITKIWENLESNLNVAFNTDTAAVNNVCKDISDKLNA